VTAAEMTAAQRWRDGGRSHWLQAFEDAIKFRQARAAASCSDGGTAAGGCDEHARDRELIAAYQRTARQLLQDPPDRPVPAAAPMLSATSRRLRCTFRWKSRVPR